MMNDDNELFTIFTRSHTINCTQKDYEIHEENLQKLLSVELLNFHNLFCEYEA